MTYSQTLAGLGAWSDTEKVIAIMKKKILYSEHISEAVLPIGKRTPSVPSRKGDLLIVRRHHMSMDEQKSFKTQAAEAGRFISPYREGSIYWSIIETLSLLGENREHTFAEFWTKLEEVMSEQRHASGHTQWEKYYGRPVRSSTTGKNVIDRTRQNIRVLQRLGGANPYGLKLAQLNACIDVLGSKKDIRLCLRTGIPNGDEVVPVCEIRGRSYEVVSVKAGYSVTEPVGEATSVAVEIQRAIGKSSVSSSIEEIGVVD